MKALKIGVSVVAISTLSIIGSYWYIGSQIETRYKGQIEYWNAELRKLRESNIRASIETIRFDKGIFTSDSAIRLRIEADGEEFSIDGENKIYHGPFPLNKFVPAAASVNTHWNTPRNLEDFISSKTLGQGGTTFYFGGDIVGDFNLSPLDIINSEGTFKSSPLVFRYDYNQEKGSGSGSLGVDNFSIKANGNSIELKGVKFSSQYTPEKKYRYLGNLGLGFNINNLDVYLKQGKKSTELNLNDLHFSEQGVVKNNRFQAERNLKVGKSIVNGLNTGKLDFVISANLDADPIDRLGQSFAELLEYKRIPDEAKIQALIEELLWQKPQIQIKKLELENDKGKANLDAMIIFDAKNTKVLNDPEMLLKAISGTGFNLSVDRGYIEETLRVFSILDGKKLDQAIASSKMSVDILFKKAIEAGEYIEIKGDKLISAIFIDGNELIMNGKKMTQKEKERILFGGKLISASSFIDTFESRGLYNTNNQDIVEDIDSSKSLSLENVKENETVLEEVSDKAQVSSQSSDIFEQIDSTKNVVTPELENSDANLNLNDACQIKSSADSIMFLQACLRTNPNSIQIRDIIAQAKSAGMCDVAQRLYANKGQNDADIALAYAKEYDPKFADSNSCFSANKNTALYWYETAVGLGNSEALSYLKELRK